MNSIDFDKESQPSVCILTHWCLFQTDAGFLSTLHDAYVQSLNQGLSARSDKKHWCVVSLLL